MEAVRSAGGPRPAKDQQRFMTLLVTFSPPAVPIEIEEDMKVSGAVTTL
jgi:hypothetical protein